MLQKRDRKTEKLLKKIKTLSFLACLLMLFAIGEVLYRNFLSEKALFISPLSGKPGNQLEVSLNKKNIEYSKLDEYPSYYIITLKAGEAVTVSKNKNIDQQLSSLQLIQSRLKIEGKDFKSLDLRFAQPVIVQ